MIRPTRFLGGHYECRSFSVTLPVLRELLALEVVEEKRDVVLVKHPNTGWLLMIHQGGPDAPDKPRFNHYGVRVTTDQEIENAYEYLQSKKKEYGLKVDKVRDNHHAHSVHFVEPGGNWWEIESYEKAIDKGLGQTAAPHWTKLLPKEKFPGKGYLPQALTHGTVQCDNLSETRRFYEDCLGLEVVQLWPNSIYVKHPTTPWYVVNLQSASEQRKYLTPLQRFTLALESKAAVNDAHRWLREHGKEFDITGLEDVQETLGGASFLLSDLNKNWWEICADFQ
jgi:catechol-2,3-dioxygenase